MAVTPPRSEYDVYYTSTDFPPALDQPFWNYVYELYGTYLPNIYLAGHLQLYLPLGEANTSGIRSQLTRKWLHTEDGTLSSFIQTMIYCPNYDSSGATLTYRVEGESANWIEIEIVTANSNGGHNGGDVFIYLRDSEGILALGTLITGGCDYNEQLYLQLRWYADGSTYIRVYNSSTQNQAAVYGTTDLFAYDEELTFIMLYEGTPTGNTWINVLYMDTDVIVAGPIWSDLVGDVEPFTLATTGGSTAPDHRHAGMLLFPDYDGLGETWLDWENIFYAVEFRTPSTNSPLTNRISPIGFDMNLHGEYTLQGLYVNWYGHFPKNTSTTWSATYENYIRLTSSRSGKWIEIGAMYKDATDGYRWGYRAHDGTRDFNPSTLWSFSYKTYWFRVNTDWSFTLNLNDELEVDVPDLREFLDAEQPHIVTFHSNGLRWYDYHTYEQWAYEIPLYEDACMDCSFNVEADASNINVTHLCYLRSKIDSNIPRDPESLTAINPLRAGDDNRPLVAGDTVIVVDRFHREFYYLIQDGASGVSTNIPYIVKFKEHEWTDLYAELLNTSYQDGFSPIVEQHIISSLIDTTPVTFDLDHSLDTAKLSFPVIQIIHEGKVKTNGIRVYHVSSSRLRFETTSTTALLDIKVNLFYVRTSA